VKKLQDIDRYRHIALLKWLPAEMARNRKILRQSVVISEQYEREGGGPLLAILVAAIYQRAVATISDLQHVITDLATRICYSTTGALSDILFNRILQSTMTISLNNHFVSAQS
jgi:hypothetical protein